MIEELEKRAWKDEPTPETENKHVYIMLRELYRLTRATALPQDTAKAFKTVLMDYESQRTGDKRALLYYCLVNLYGRMGGDMGLQRDAWTLIEYAMARWSDG